MGEHGASGPTLPPGRLPPGRDVWLPGRGRTFVRDAGGPPGAPALVLLHGWTATADLNWFACYAPLAERFRVVALDHRGHGRGLRTAEPFRLEDCADDVATLAHELGLDRIVPVGYSMGGPIAQLVWRRHRELVAGLVLCATSASFTGTVRERLLFGVAGGTCRLAGTAPIGRLAGAGFTRWTDWRSRRGEPWWGLDEIGRHDWARIVEAGRSIGCFDSRGWVGRIDVPAAVVVTDDDDVVPVPRQLALADRIPGASVWRVAGGHAVCTTAPERFVSTLVAACAATVVEASTPLAA